MLNRDLIKSLTLLIFFNSIYFILNRQKTKNIFHVIKIAKIVWTEFPYITMEFTTNDYFPVKFDVAYTKFDIVWTKFDIL